MARKRRDNRFGMLLSKKEMDMLDTLSKASGLDRSSLIRSLLRECWGERRSKAIILGWPEKAGKHG